MTLKAELTRSIEVVLAGNHFVAELSTGFEKSLINRYQLLAFAFDDQSGGILILSKKKKKVRLSLPPFLPLYKAIELCSKFLSCRKKRKEKKKKKDRERIFQQRKRQICRRYYPSMRAGPPNPGPRSAATRAGMKSGHAQIRGVSIVLPTCKPATLKAAGTDICGKLRPARNRFSFCGPPECNGGPAEGT